MKNIDIKDLIFGNFSKHYIKDLPGVNRPITNRVIVKFLKMRVSLRKMFSILKPK